MPVIVTDTLMGLILMQPCSQGLSVVQIRDGTGPRQKVYLSVYRCQLGFQRLYGHVREVDSDFQRGTIRATVLLILKKQVFLNKFLYLQ